MACRTLKIYRPVQQLKRIDKSVYVKGYNINDLITSYIS